MNTLIQWLLQSTIFRAALVANGWLNPSTNEGALRLAALGWTKPKGGGGPGEEQ